MGALKCEKCGADMKIADSECPACGEKVKPASGAAIVLMLTVVGLAVWGTVSFVSNFRAKVAANAKPVLSAADCRKDLACWAERNLIDASAPCTKAIEARAKWQVEWIDGILEPKFDRFKAGETASVVIYMGDKVKFQNGFGAWGRMRYACYFDTDKGAVDSVLVGDLVK